MSTASGRGPDAAKTSIPGRTRSAALHWGGAAGEYSAVSEGGGGTSGGGGGAAGGIVSSSSSSSVSRHILSMDDGSDTTTSFSGSTSSGCGRDAMDTFPKMLMTMTSDGVSSSPVDQGSFAFRALNWPTGAGSDKKCREPLIRGKRPLITSGKVSREDLTTTGAHSKMCAHTGLISTRISYQCPVMGIVITSRSSNTRAV